MYDGVRPRSVQAAIWKVVEGTPKARYFISPDRISIHAYGCAVDVGIVNEQGHPLDMGTDWDYLDEIAQPRYESRFLREGRLTSEQIDNRKLLRTAMKSAGFESIATEWWHFDAYTRAFAEANFEPIP